jgi:hypothetical protein
MTKQATPELPDSVRFDTFNDYVAVRYGNPRGYRLVGVIVKDSVSGWRLELLEGTCDFRVAAISSGCSAPLGVSGHDSKNAPLL